jgi:hypothetical protein
MMEKRKGVWYEIIHSISRLTQGQFSSHSLLPLVSNPILLHEAAIDSFYVDIVH